MKPASSNGQVAFIVLAALALSQLWAGEVVAKEPLVVFFVRHAEKVDTSADPELSAAGKERAKQLANALRDAELEHVHSSDYIRTRDTAGPIASRLKLNVEIYDSRDVPALIHKLRQTGGRHLVVGHSSTTPKAVALLGGKAGDPIAESSEFDRLYIVTVDKMGAVSTVLMRYGNRAERSP